MASKAERRRLFAALAATALAAAIYWLGTGLQPQAWLTWLAPLPILWLAPRVRSHVAALAAFLAAVIGSLNQWHYLHSEIALPLTVIVPITIAPGIVLALCALLFRRLLLAGRGIAAALAVPALWCAVEYVNNVLSPHGTFGSISYTQMDLLPVIQLAAITGIWGISFLLLLVPSAIAVAAAPRLARRSGLAVAGMAALLLLASLVYGYARLQAGNGPSLRIGLVSLEKPIRPALQDPAGQALLQRYLSAIDGLAKSGAQVVVIPETSFATADRSVDALADLARRDGLTLAVGIEFKGELGVERNMQMVFAPGQAAPATYSKHHLIPGYEDRYKPGDSYTMLDGSPRVGLAVCKDMDFHDIGRAYAARQAQLLLVPAWDFGVDGWLHGRMAIMRGVENGFAIARAARTGRLTLSDDRGRVVAEASSEQQDASLVGELPLHRTQTLYARWGDWFAWLDLALLAGLLMLAWRRSPG